MTLLHSPLDAAHRALGAKFAPFGGWEMPIQYDGVLEEHRACRHDAVRFDVSHLGTLHVRGEGALALLQRAFTNDLERIGPGRAQYTHLCDPADGHVEDDIIVWWVAPDDFRVMPNASNTQRIVAALDAERAAAHAATVAIDDVTRTRAVIAVQGPNARARLATISPDAAAVARFAVVPVVIDGAACVVAGTGYTGEDGVEIDVPLAGAPALWDALGAAGVRAAGLGARDTLRLEAGLPLHGHELGPGITPFEARLGWVVRFAKGDFRGATALQAQLAAGVPRELAGLVADDRRPPREHCTVLLDGAAIGTVTSGNFSPELGRGIALAFLPPGAEPGTRVEIDVRGKALPATVVRPPFVS